VRSVPHCQRTILIDNGRSARFSDKVNLRLYTGLAALESLNDSRPFMNTRVRCTVDNDGWIKLAVDHSCFKGLSTDRSVTDVYSLEENHSLSFNHR